MTSSPVLSTAWAQSYKEDAHRLSFLDLPRELRDHIYSYTFHVSGAILVYTQNLYQPERTLRAKIVRNKNSGAVEPQSLSKHISMGLHVTITTEAAHRIFGAKLDLDSVSYGWKRRFWPSILESGKKIIVQFPNVENLTVSMKSGVESTAWRPAFFAVGGKTAERRIELAAEWMLERCPLEDERLHECLHLELVPPPGSISKEEYAGSRFAPDDEEWDYTEFENAFELMKALG